MKARHCSHCFQLRGQFLLALFFCVFSASDGHKKWEPKMGALAPIFTLLCLLDVERIGGEDHPCGIGVEMVVRQEGDAAEVDR